MVSAAAPPPRRLGPLTEGCGDDVDPSLEAYLASGGYAGARRALCDLDRDSLAELVAESGLQARGRWSRDVAFEWRMVASAPHGERGLVCHAGLPGPGAAPDRMLVERAPHRILDGVLVAARALGAERAQVCLAADHAAGHAAMQGAVVEATEAGHIGGDGFGSGVAIDVEVVHPTVATACGGGTAILEALAGRAARPCPRPPAAAKLGLSDRPTWVADAETFGQLALVARHGAAWLREQGQDDAPGTAVFQVSGHIERPGLYELPLGTRLGTLVFEHAGGVAGGRKVGAVLPGGRSAPALPPGQLDVPLTDAALREKGSELGRGHVVVIDDATCMVAAAGAIGAYFRGLSCGHAVTCREGAALMDELVGRVGSGDASEGDLTVLLDLCDELRLDDHCGVADRVGASVRSLVTLFRDDFESHLHGHGCGRSVEVALS